MVSKIQTVLFAFFITFHNATLGMDNQVDESINETNLSTTNISLQTFDMPSSNFNIPNQHEGQISLRETLGDQQNTITRSSIITPQSTMNTLPVTANASFLERDSNLFTRLNDAVIDFEPLIRSLGLTRQAEHFSNTFNFLVHNYLTPQDVYVSEMIAISAPRQTQIFDWVTNGWKCAKWAVGTSQNIATILIGIGGIAANFFKDQAVILATISAIVAAGGTLLSLVYDYCDKKRLNRIARNLVIMAIQAAKAEEERMGEV